MCDYSDPLQIGRSEVRSSRGTTRLFLSHEDSRIAPNGSPLSGHGVDQRLGHAVIGLHDRGVGGKAVACDHLVDHLLGDIDVRRDDFAILIGEGR